MSKRQNAEYQLDENGEFVIENYNRAKLFSSFFPGIAGKHGIPMWTFYVNRGQCICSMGIDGKHHPIMEFLPANWAYNLVSSQGFRTFVKLNPNSQPSLYEPFQNSAEAAAKPITQRMIIAPDSLCLEEINLHLGLGFKVEYYNVPQDSYAGLIRRLSITNLSSSDIHLQVLDGLPLIIPYGLDDFGLKHMRRLFEAFVEVTNFENKIPFFKLKVEPADRPDVVRIKKGNFYLGFSADNQLVNPIYDPVKIFGNRGDFAYPEGFISSDLEQLNAGQIFENRLPCAMGSFEATIKVNRTYTYNSIIGHAGSEEEINDLAQKIANNTYIENKAIENKEIVLALTQKSLIDSSEPAWNQYARQNFLDNVMRGGFPYTIKGKKSLTTLHLYSRKHGDMERDYNDYRLTPTPYSQGNGNFRDVNQNRRSDLFFNPEVKDSNVIQFYNLIQLDGFNPLVIKEMRFSLPDGEAASRIVAEYIPSEHRAEVQRILLQPFTPGQLLALLKDMHVSVTGDADLFIGDLLGISHRHQDTDHAEGFWTDHWTYNLDLLENYLAIYPEKKREILYQKKEFTFYDNAHRVQPRADKYVVWEDKPMQLNSVIHDAEKEQMIQARTHSKNRVRTACGKGSVYYTTLFEKLLTLILNKISSLDPNGVGIEMETNKPNWYDALNGLPGLFGSSISESLELKRHIIFLKSSLNLMDDEVSLAVETKRFFLKMLALLLGDLTSMEYWDFSYSAKEEFRSLTRLGLLGDVETISQKLLSDFLDAALTKLEDGISKAWNPEAKVINTYFINQVVEYEYIQLVSVIGAKTPKLNSKGLPCIRPKSFVQIPLPLFLEGPVHFLRCAKDHLATKELAKSVRESALFDPLLKMYKVNESLNSQIMEIGRARTFSPGWFENESIWLHMEYKYMLELLSNGLYDEFFRDFDTVFVPFFQPEIYGRSTLENSSFIVSSANPDPSLFGNGFVARLSGATAEFISISMMMAFGKNPFTINESGELQMQFSPVLPARLFTTAPKLIKLLKDGRWHEISLPANTYSFMFLGDILVTYHNPTRQNTFGEGAVKPVKWEFVHTDGSSEAYDTSILPSAVAHKVRDNMVKRILVELA